MNQVDTRLLSNFLHALPPAGPTMFGGAGNGGAQIGTVQIDIYDARDPQAVAEAVRVEFQEILRGG